MCKTGFQSLNKPCFIDKYKEVGKVMQVERSDLAGWAHWLWHMCQDRLWLQWEGNVARWLPTPA